MPYMVPVALHFFDIYTFKKLYKTLNSNFYQDFK